jgi:ubiquinone/menaquinone biosynthesis C-methylase UbiE
VRRLAASPELLDGPLDDERALDGNLRDLRRINALLGGARLSHEALATLAVRAGSAAGAPIRVLDVGTGGADIPVAIRARWRGPGPAPEFVATDSRAEVLAAARRVTPGLARGGVDLAVADGRALSWPDGAFDVAHVSMVVHHLSPAEAVALLLELRRVARHGVVVNDLTRAPIHLAGAWLMSHSLTTNRFTRHDAPLSVRRAYTGREALALVRAAGLRPVAMRRAAFGHRYAIAAVPR